MTRVKRGLKCAGHWVVGIWAIYRLEMASRGTVYTTASAGRLSSASRERTVDTGHSDDRDKERQRAGWEVGGGWLLCITIYKKEDVWMI